MAIGILPLALIALIVLFVTRLRRTPTSSRAFGSRRPPMTPERTAQPAGNPVDIRQYLEEWVIAGLLSQDQASAILDHERSIPAVAPARPSDQRRIPVIAEALGYLGGALAVVGVGLALSRAWKDVATGGRLGLSLTGAVLLLVAGALVKEGRDSALTRLRWTLWLASTAASAFAAGIVVHDGLGFDNPSTIVLGVAAATTVHAGLTWWWRARPLQELVCLGGLLVTIGATAALLADDGPTGLAVWLGAAVLLAVGLRGVPPLPQLAEGVGALGVVAGAVMVTSSWPGAGLLLSLATASGLVALSLVPGLAPGRTDERLVGLVGGIALLQAGPSTLGYFSQQAGGPTGLLTWAAGGALIALGVRGTVRGSRPIETVGAIVALVGAALTGTQWAGFAPFFGVATAGGLIGLGMLPGNVVLSLVGSLGLLADVPWAISRYFPGEGRVPLLIFASGVVLVGVAVFLARMSDRLRLDLGRRRPRSP